MCVFGHLVPWLLVGENWRARNLQVFSSSLEKRLKSDRRKKWDKKQEAALEAAHRALNAFDDANADPGSSPELRTQRQNLVDAVDTLKALQGSYDDPGPL